MARKRRLQSDSEGEEDPETQEESPQAKKKRVSSVKDADDEKTMDQDDFNCSQAPDFTVSTLSEAEVGIIEKITLVNFMCHTMLEVPLGANVNFIIGRNGSGKSAIMTALVVGLGGKAATTNRGSSLKGFIKDKCSYGQVSIKLRNRGQDAYRPDDYGESITVERRISSDGSGSYKLKSHEGKVISQKKDELNHILDQFNIQVDNPVSVLNQDTSRNFLNSSDPKDKYKFFLKATQLEQMSSDYQLIIEQQDIIKNTLDRKQETLPAMQRQVQTLEEKYKDIAQLKNMKEQVEDLKKNECGQKLETLKSKLVLWRKKKTNRRRSCPDTKRELQGARYMEEVRNLEEEWRKVNEQLNAITEEGKELGGQQQAICNELKKKKNTYRDRQSALRKLRQEKNTSENDQKQLMDRIQEIKQTAMRDLESERQQRHEALQQKRDELKGWESQLSTTNHHRGQLEQAISRARERTYQLSTDLKDANHRLDAAQRQVRDLQGSRNNKLKLFGAWVPELLQRVEQAERRGKFHRKPVGPIGAHLTLRDERWALAVESCIKKFGWAFCCTDNHDQQVLKQLFQQVCSKDNIPTIIVSRFQDNVHNVSANKPRCDFPSVLDMLIIDDPVAIESVLLIEDPKVARQVMFQNPPAKVRMAYAMNGDQLLGGKTARSYASLMDKARYLQKDIEVEIRQLEQEIEHKRQHQQQCQRDLNDVDKTVKENTRELQKAKQKAFREQEGVNKSLGEITELENYEEEDLPDVTTLEEEVEHYTQQLEDLGQQTTVVEEEVEKAQDELSKQQLKEAQHKEKIQSLLEKADPFRTQQHDIEVNIETQKSHRKHYETRLRELQDSIKKAEREHETMKKLVRVKTEQATQFCERVATRRTVKNLESEIIQKTRRIQTEERNKGKHEDITREYFEAKKRYEGIMESLKNLKKYSKRLRKVMEDRAKAFVNYRHFIAIRAKFFFQMMLSQRGYNGKMVFDHGNESLGLQVNVEQGTKRVAKDTRSLSGGERSFSTVSFIMALWEAMESPFRCLDEFDVFMDMVNRRISMEMMLKVAKEQQERQFILLTPQDMSSIGSSRSVRIFRLRDPERGQTTLDFQPPEE
ncbi:Structural maintenance of chromosomes protein 6 [Desmophyllum pertusum]|uniref:Structural maintenance of chromosomes protein 6 n=1 Tax=Desmophyllum pertusum TaxID=174260 RepID=A0A9X0D3U2_9CNID|nr:Structural maintenance of chromosomes protein 6 [Desmophyllum pertusum]